MEQKKIDEITSINYVGLEPSFKILYLMLISLPVTFIVGVHHIILKDIKGFIFHWVLQIVLSLLMVTFFFVCFPLGIFLALAYVAYWLIPVLVAFYCYTDNEYFESIKNKKSWPLINWMLMIVPKNQK